MIDAKELRIGNLVAYKGNSFPVDGLGHDTIHVGLPGNYSRWMEFEAIDPIPITPEWLERLGFELHKPCGDEGFIKWRKDGVILLWIEGKFWHDHWSTGIWITSVHQLQNLYFALTGEELTVKT